MKNKIYNYIKANKIQIVTLDPNGLCNSKCWYCPVRYKGNPKEFIHQMPIEQVEKILINIRNSSCGGNVRDFTMSNFNEVFLYKDFKKLMILLEKYNFYVTIMSNATTLNEEIIDILYNSKIIDYIDLNIPTLDKEEWKKKTELSDSIYEKLIENLNILHDKIDSKFRVHINMHNMEDNPYNSKFKNAILDDHYKINEYFNNMRLKYPKFKITSITGLIDRCGILSDHSVYKDRNVYDLHKNEKVIGCSFSIKKVSKLYNLISINSKGDLFLCCNDFDMKYIIGNVLEQSLDDIWYSDKHVDTMIEMFENYCHRCTFRVVYNKKNKLII